MASDGLGEEGAALCSPSLTTEPGLFPPPALLPPLLFLCLFAAAGAETVVEVEAFFLPCFLPSRKVLIRMNREQFSTRQG